MSAIDQTSQWNRRRFLQTSSAVGIGLLGASASVGRDVCGANERLSIGLIGVGIRGTYHLRALASLAERYNVQVTAVCDVWKPNLERAAAAVKEKWGQVLLQSSRYGDLLEREDLDGVVIATPDFSHPAIALAAMRAGKDVFIEKPMAIEMDDANQILDLAREKKAVVQVGTQRRSNGKFRGAAKVVESGVLGQITRVSSEYNFNQPRWARPFEDCKEADVDWDAFLMDRPKCAFDARLIRQWQLHKQFTNGLPGQWMAHYLDAVNMVLGTTYPSAVVALGGVYIWNKGRETCDTFRAVVEYPEGVLMCWGLGLGNEAGRYWTIHGTKGTLDLQNWMLLREGGKNTQVTDKPIPSVSGDSHMGSWLSCIRSRKSPTANVEAGHQHAVGSIMAALARDSGQRQIYNPSHREINAG